MEYQLAILNFGVVVLCFLIGATVYVYERQSILKRRKRRIIGSLWRAAAGGFIFFVVVRYAIPIESVNKIFDRPSVHSATALAAGFFPRLCETWMGRQIADILRIVSISEIISRLKNKEGNKT